MPVLILVVVAVGFVQAAQTPQAPEPRRIELQSPMNTMVRAEQVPRAPLHIEAEIVVGQDAPDDLGVGAFVSDGHGRWFRSPTTSQLDPGRHLLSFDLSDHADLVCEPNRACWDAYARSQVREAGLYFWSATASRTAIQIIRLQVSAEGTPASGSPTPAVASPAPLAPATAANPTAVLPTAARLCRLQDLRLDGMNAGSTVMRGRTGARWTLSLRPDPFPSQPYDLARFTLAAVITTPDGQQVRIGGFYRQPLDLVDEGDRELGLPTAGGRFEVRYRPGLPGTYKMSLEAAWDGQAKPLTMTLPDLVVDGDPWDDIVRADPLDPRFFSTGSRIDQRRFFWPIGLNLHSVWDMRTRDCCRTILTPGRLWNAYDAYLRRLAAAGGTAAEIWLCSWGLALEWRGEWTEFHGAGCYSDQNAERLDRVLDLASSLGIRVNLVINNHGQASTGCDKEWDANPWNTANGGPVDQAEHFFTDAAALDGQERYRRYIIARWADHPAVLGWKLWSEQNLTAGGGNLRAWHVHAAERWEALDHYGHGVTTHWSGDYHAPDRGIVEQPALSYVCIDAYHGRETLLAQLIWDGNNAGDSLARFGKPVLVTEYGGTSGAGPQAQIIAEHHSGPFAAMVSGCSGSPMLWWFEWVDQRDQWSPYSAISRFLAGEDLRGADAKPVALNTSGGDGALWARAWSRPGRLLGYVLDADWGQLGEVDRAQAHVTVHVGDQVQAGAMIIEWWDAEKGIVVGQATIMHEAGPLDLTAPAFSRHLAFKLYREHAPRTALR
jgi:hypothetical protein